MQEGEREEGPKGSRRTSERRCCQNGAVEKEQEFARKPEGKIQATYWGGTGVTRDQSFQSSYLYSARLHQALFCGVLGVQGAPLPAPCTRQVWVQVFRLQDGWEYAVAKVSALCAPVPNRNMETEWLYFARQSQ